MLERPRPHRHAGLRALRPAAWPHTGRTHMRRLLDGPAAAGDDPGLPHYNDVSRKLILAFKHGDGLQLTPFLTSLMARDFAMMTDGEDSRVVPVPLHR